jgi:hypothetical protein
MSRWEVARMHSSYNSPAIAVAGPCLFGCVALAQLGAPTNQTRAIGLDRRIDGTPIVTESNFREIEYAREMHELVQRSHARLVARDAGTNDWEAFAEAGLTLRNAIRDFEQEGGLKSDHDGVDFEEVYDPRPGTDDQDRERLEAKRHHTVDFLLSPRAKDLQSWLDEMRSPDRALRWQLGSEAHGRFLARCGREKDFEPNGLMLTTLVPEIGGARALARMCAARMELASRDRDWSGVARWAEHGWSIARIALHQGLLMDRGVGNGVRMLIGDRLRSIADRHPLPADTLESLLRIEREQLRDLVAMSVIIETERLIQLQICTAVYADDGTINRTGLEQVVGLEGAGSVYLALSAWPDPAWTIRRYNEIHDDFQTFAAKPPAQQNADQLVVRQLNVSTNVKDTLPSITTSATAKTISTDVEAECRMAGLRGTLAIELFQRRTGRWPMSLQEIEATGIPCLVTDPYTSAPLRLVVDNASGRARRYRLYSVGLDGQDNDGVSHSKKPELAFSRSEGLGSDYVFAERQETGSRSPDE